MDLALNSLQCLICHKTKPQPIALTEVRQGIIFEYISRNQMNLNSP